MPPGQGYVNRQQRSVEPAHFAMNPRNDIPRSVFDSQWFHKTTFSAGYLIPVFVDEVLPGDSFRVKMDALLRIATPLFPIIDNLILETFWFFTPTRLVWTNFQRFMGEQLTPTDFTEFLFPQVAIPSGSELASLWDYFGITMNNNAESQISVRADFSRSYNLIYNEFFRDEDLQVPVVVDTDDGPDDGTTAGDQEVGFTGDYVLMRRGKRHDYFTTARPWPSKPIPIGQFQSRGLGGPNSPTTSNQWGVVSTNFTPMAGAPVSGLGVPPGAAPNAAQDSIETGRRGRTYPFAFASNVSGSEFIMAADANNPDGYPDVRVLVSDLRTAVLIQHLIEANSRGGTRYTELVRSLFGVLSPDARLQRPEYLGGGRTYVNVHPVAQTSATGVAGTTTVMGELTGVGTAIVDGHGFSQSFTEHGCIIGLVSIRADLTYQQGVNRMWFRRNRYDFYVPQLANLSEQAILMKELYALGAQSSALDEGVWGYQERWAEYKWKPSRTSGPMRSGAGGSLDAWHLGQDFGPAPGPGPVLGPTFIVENPPIGRALQVSTFSDQHFIMDCLFHRRAARAMPMYSLPGAGGRL